MFSRNSQGKILPKHPSSDSPISNLFNLAKYHVSHSSRHNLVCICNNHSNRNNRSKISNRSKTLPDPTFSSQNSNIFNLANKMEMSNR